MSAQRKTLVGSGDRSERIRTYNYPQVLHLMPTRLMRWNNLHTVFVLQGASQAASTVFGIVVLSDVCMSGLIW